MRDRLPDREYLQEMVRYDPETGRLFFLERPRHHFPTDGAWKIWLARFAGKPAFATVNRAGYLCGSIQNKVHRAHRVVWKLFHDGCPEQIDHINGDKQDNRIENLRAADNFINAQNQKLHSRNKSGVPGVHQTQFGTWYAEITAHRVYHRLGTFKQKSDAIAARKNAERIHGFHPNHGSKT